jgi:hypothetical protein
VYCLQKEQKTRDLQYVFSVYPVPIDILRFPLLDDLKNRCTLLNRSSKSTETWRGLTVDVALK